MSDCENGNVQGENLNEEDDKVVTFKDLVSVGFF